MYLWLAKSQAGWMRQLRFVVVRSIPLACDLSKQWAPLHSQDSHARQSLRTTKDSSLVALQIQQQLDVADDRRRITARGHGAGVRRGVLLLLPGWCLRYGRSRRTRTQLGH